MPVSRRHRDNKCQSRARGECADERARVLSDICKRSIDAALRLITTPCNSVRYCSGIPGKTVMRRETGLN